MSIDKWNKNLPILETPIVDIPVFHTENWEAIEEFFGVQHRTFTETASGRHIPGFLPILHFIESADDLPSEVTEGGLIFVKNTGEIYLGHESSWTATHNLNTSYVNAYLSNEFGVPASTCPITVPFNLEIIDTLNEFIQTGQNPYYFQPKSSGKFLIRYVLSVTPSKKLALLRSYISVATSEGELYTAGYVEQHVFSDQQYFLSNSAILNLQTNQRVRIKFAIGGTSEVTGILDDGPYFTSVFIRRLS